VVELLEWLAFTTFGAREVRDGTSAFAGRLGQRVTGARVTLFEDGADERSFVARFDREGTARARVTLIENGVATSALYDRLHALREGRRSTGNAAPASAWEDAPIAQALTMQGGEDTLEGLIAKVDRGLWISRFHYVNGFIEPRRTVMTGLTRDGTFEIERGARGRGVRNMRFTDSVFEALTRCEGLTRALECVATSWNDGGAISAPALLIRGLRFTGGGVQPPTV
jgi:predicted Zn-dependent protease